MEKSLNQMFNLWWVVAFFDDDDTDEALLQTWKN